MARKRSPDFAKRRDRIVANAAHLFAQRGFMGTSIADLTSAGKISKALFYHYFASKEDVLYAAMSTHVDALEAAAQDVRQGGQSDPEVMLRDLTSRFMQIYIGATDLQKVLLNEVENLPPAMAEAVTAKQKAIVHTVEGIMARITGQEDHALNTVHTMLYFGMMNWLHTWYDGSKAVSPEALVDEIVRFVMQGAPARES